MSTTIITGTSSGIGLAAAVHFARRGHHVYATMRDTSRSADLEKAAADAGVEVTVRQLDVDDDSSIERCLGAIIAEQGRVDLLVNNAGVAWMRPWELAPMEEIEQTFRTNFFGAVRCAMAVVPTMRRQGSGAIVNISSIAGRMGLPIQGPYCASKAAMLAFTESLAIELREHGVRVFSVLPGFTSTPILTKVWDDYRAEPTNPYGALWDRWSALYDQGRTMACDPTVVAEVVEHALEQPDVIHSLSGPDAPTLVRAWGDIGDHGRLAYGDKQTDEEWFTRFARDFPMDG
jgi:NAD(P)-dependent dehydrogenase (short-subunit alcohol dehydrogenase family)